MHIGHTTKSNFENIPRRIFLDSSTLQTLQDYGGFLYENESLTPSDRIHRDARGIQKLDALRFIMAVTERAQFEFALSENSLFEVQKRGDLSYLNWAYDVLDHWRACLTESERLITGASLVNRIDPTAFGYLGTGDRVLLEDALSLDCDTFMTMENKLPKNAGHIKKALGIRVFTPVEVWEALRPWAGLFR
ncbi:MAG: hypothetical protein JWQ21_2949 [Herminiimonas sp.]|nr:hypothetical protein [Herminiimonas sp.]